MLFCHPCGDRQAYGSRLAPNRRRETCHLSVSVVRLFGRPSLKVARHFPQSPSNPKVNRGAGHRNESFKDGAVLRTIGDAANDVLALPQEQAEHCNRWRHAAQLLLDQADVAAVSHQVHLALFYDAQLDLGAMR